MGERAGMSHSFGQVIPRVVLVWCCAVSMEAPAKGRGLIEVALSGFDDRIHFQSADDHDHITEQDEIGEQRDGDVLGHQPKNCRRQKDPHIGERHLYSDHRLGDVFPKIGWG